MFIFLSPFLQEDGPHTAFEARQNLPYGMTQITFIIYSVPIFSCSFNRNEQIYIPALLRLQ